MILIYHRADTPLTGRQRHFNGTAFALARRFGASIERRPEEGNKLDAHGIKLECGRPKDEARLLDIIERRAKTLVAAELTKLGGDIIEEREAAAKAKAEQEAEAQRLKEEQEAEAAAAAVAEAEAKAAEAEAAAAEPGSEPEAETAAPTPRAEDTQPNKPAAKAKSSKSSKSSKSTSKKK